MWTIYSKNSTQQLHNVHEYYIDIYYIFKKKLHITASLTMASTMQCIENSSIINCTICK